MLCASPEPNENNVYGLVLIVSISIVAAAFVCFGTPALSDSWSCDSLKSSQRSTLQSLFLYSQFAERPEDIEPHEPTECLKGEARLATSLPEINPIPIGSIMPSVKRLLSQFKDFGEIQKAFAEPSQQIDNMLHVGCRHTMLDIDVAVEMRFFRRDRGADIVQLGVVHRPIGGNSSNWAPVIESRDATSISKSDVVSLPGTDSLRLFWTNFSGEECVFPAARFTINAMCEYANGEDGKASDSSLRTEDGKPTLVGHSLGGATAQYIATSKPFRGEPKCPGVDAYAFGSTGLTTQLSSMQSVGGGTLISYVSECDWLVQFAFASRIQPGRVFTLSQTDSHFIDGIQGDICKCLRGEERHQFGEYDLTLSAPPNRKLCQ